MGSAGRLRRIRVAVAVEIVVPVEARQRAVAGPVTEVVQPPAEVAFERYRRVSDHNGPSRCLYGVGSDICTG